MRSSTLLFAISLLGNAILATFITVRHLAAVTSDAASDVRAAPDADAGAGTLADRVIGLREENPWEQLRAGDDADLVARLRAAGFPPRAIRVIVRAEVAERFKDRQREIDAMRRQRPWWHVSAHFENDAYEVQVARRALQRDIDAAVSRALGVEASLLTDAELAKARRRHGNFPRETLARLQAIQRDYVDLREAVHAEAKGALLAEDRQRLALLEQEERADIARLLTPEELAEFDRHASPTASDLRWQLRTFDLTEAEYLAVYEIRREFDARYGVPRNLTPAQRDARRAAEPELNAAIAGALGPARHREFTIATDPAFSSVKSIVDNHDLPAATTRDIVALQLDVTAQATGIRNDPQLSDAQRAARLAALAETVTTQLAATLGPAAFSEYKTDAGKWIDQLRPTPTP